MLSEQCLHLHRKFFVYLSSDELSPFFDFGNKVLRKFYKLLFCRDGCFFQILLSSRHLFEGTFDVNFLSDDIKTF